VRHRNKHHVDGAVEFTVLSIEVAVAKHARSDPRLHGWIKTRDLLQCAVLQHQLQAL